MRTLAILALLAGCGDNLHGLALEELEGARIAAECERYVRCGTLLSEDTCRAYFRRDYDHALPEAVAAGKIELDPLAAAACLDALAARSCDSTAADNRREPEVCARVLVGQLPAGATCSDDRTCGSQRCDAPRCNRDACCPGGCAAYAPPAKLDEACDREVGCVDGAFCGADKLCHAVGATGAACQSDPECALGLGCVGITSTQDGACRALPKLGEACPYQRCAEIGARCDRGVCVPVGTANAPCASDGDCSEFYVCDPTTSRCIDTPVLGEACFGRCAGEAWCELASGTCVPPQPNAAPCTANDQCGTLFCEEGPVFDQCAEPAVCF